MASAPKDAAFPPGIVGEVSGSGPDLIWTHGLSSSRAAEDESDLYGITSIPGFRVTRWDAPGHGESAPVFDDETTRWPRLGQLLLDVADGVGAGRFVAAGASMGTATSLWAAVLDPERIAALVLVIPPTAWETRAAQAGLYLDAVDRLEREGIGAYLDALDERPLNPSLEGRAIELRAATRARLERADVDSLAHVQRGAAASNFPVGAQVATLDMPVLLLAWEGDPGHPRSSAEELARLLPQAEFVVATDLAGIAAWRSLAARWLSSLDLSDAQTP